MKILTIIITTVNDNTRECSSYYNVGKSNIELLTIFKILLTLIFNSCGGHNEIMWGKSTYSRWFCWII